MVLTCSISLYLRTNHSGGEYRRSPQIRRRCVCRVVPCYSHPVNYCGVVIVRIRNSVPGSPLRVPLSRVGWYESDVDRTGGTRGRCLAHTARRTQIPVACSPEIGGWSGHWAKAEVGGRVRLFGGDGVVLSGLVCSHIAFVGVEFWAARLSARLLGGMVCVSVSFHILLADWHGVRSVVKFLQYPMAGLAAPGDFAVSASCSWVHCMESSV